MYLISSGVKHENKTNKILALLRGNFNLKLEKNLLPLSYLHVLSIIGFACGYVDPYLSSTNFITYAQYWVLIMFYEICI